jgi:carbonic anhydrase/acetyltransferase-like protein (isoleucine patch superfamily)
LEQGSTVLFGTTVYIAPVTNSDAIYTWAGDAGGVVTLAANKLTLNSGTLVLNDDNPIQAGDTATIEKDATLRIVSDKTLTLNYKDDISAKLVVNGTVEVAGEVVINGALEVNNGGSITFRAPFSDSAELGENGVVTLKKGSTLTVPGEDGPLTVIGAGGCFTWGSGTPSIAVSAEDEAVVFTITGSVTLSKAYHLYDDVLTVGDGGTLTLSEPLTGQSGSTFIIGDEATVIVTGTATHATSFGDDVEIEDGVVPVGTYEWDEDEEAWVVEGD